MNRTTTMTLALVAVLAAAGCNKGLIKEQKAQIADLESRNHSLEGELEEQKMNLVSYFEQQAKSASTVATNNAHREAVLGDWWLVNRKLVRLSPRLCPAKTRLPFGHFSNISDGCSRRFARRRLAELKRTLSK